MAKKRNRVCLLNTFVAVLPIVADNLDGVGAAMASTSAVIPDSDDELEKVPASGSTAMANNLSVGRPPAANKSLNPKWVTSPDWLTYPDGANNFGTNLIGTY